jgi:hypothetical protein
MALTYVLWYGERRGGVDRPRVRFFKFVIRVRSLEERIKDLEKLIFTNRDRETKKIRNRKAEGEIRTRVVASTAACFEYKPQNMLISIKGSERAGDITSPTVFRNAGYCEVQNHSNLATLISITPRKSSQAILNSA